MKRIRSLLIIDLKLVIKNSFFWVMIGMLIAMILVVNVLLPKEMPLHSPDLVTYGLELDGYRQADSIDELKELASQNADVAGIAFDQGNYTVFASHFSEKQAAAVILPFLEQAPGSTQIQVSHTENTVTPPPFHLRCLPVFLCFETVVQGFLLSGVLLLNERSGKLVRSLQVSPVKAFHYWIAKVSLFSIMGSLYALLLTVFTAGFQVPLIPFLLVSALASALFTMLGMMTAVFFRSLTNWFMLASLILGINMLTTFAYLFPSLPLPFMKLIPSYPFLFLYEQILFGHLKLTSDVCFIFLWFSALSAASLICVKRKFLQPQKEV